MKALSLSQNQKESTLSPWASTNILPEVIFLFSQIILCHALSIQEADILYFWRLPVPSV